MTNLERGYAVMDAIERVEEFQEDDENNKVFDGAANLEDLRMQAQFWFDEAKSNKRKDEMRISSSEKIEVESNDVGGTSQSNSPAVMIDSRTLPSIEKFDEISTQNKVLIKKQIRLSSDCAGKCQFNPNHFDGQICTSCFRDIFEVQNWSKFTKKEKEMAFIDMTGRMKESQSIMNNAIQWKEIDIVSQTEMKENVAPLDYDFQKFVDGDRVLQLESIVDPIICEQIVQRVRKNADNHRLERKANGLPDEGLVRLPTLDASKRAKENNTACAKPIDSDTDVMLVEILKRVLTYLDLELNSLTELIFDVKSLHQLYVEEDLIFASREPAINVYTKGGKFLAHEDGQQLTVLIPLTSPNKFDGGGTAFWSHQSRGHRVDPPSLIIKPERGAALLFGGDVTHAGQPVESGERVVFVASFSKKRPQVKMND